MFSLKFSFNSKLKIIEEFGHLDIVEKPSLS
jgi:hypothetical protein